MAEHQYDAIVVGARCAGSPTAMLLARKGYKVLLVDRATFPSDTISTHLVHPPGVAALKRWGLLDRIVATGCPPIHTYAFDFGPFTISGGPGTADAPLAYAPRRTVLDKVLVDAALEAGAEVREGFTVEDFVIDRGRVTGIRGHGQDGETVTEQGRVVIGADGLYSFVSRAVGAEQYHEKPPLLAGYYTYWSGLPMNGGFEAYDRGERNWAAWPTNDDLTLVIVVWPIAEFEANKKDIEGNYLEAFERAPEFAARIRTAKREERFVGTAVPNFFRKPYGSGWGLVGDAGYNKDFITAQGISDAFARNFGCVPEVFCDSLDWLDSDGHGTASSGIVGALHNVGGVAGICGLRPTSDPDFRVIVPLKIFPEDVPEGTNLVNALAYAGSLFPTIPIAVLEVILSVLPNDPEEEAILFRNAIHNAFHQGLFLAIAAGNTKADNARNLLPAAFLHMGTGEQPLVVMARES